LRLSGYAEPFRLPEGLFSWPAGVRPAEVLYSRNKAQKIALNPAFPLA
jgi:hypothetical protein